MKSSIFLAVVAALFATSPAQSSEHSPKSTVADPSDCTRGFAAIANYKWQDGRFVRDGWACYQQPDA